MKKIIFFSIIAIVIILVLLFFSSETVVLFFGGIFCNISPNCANVPQDSESILAQAIISKDVRVCDKLPKKVFFSVATPRADCYFDYAQETQDVDICFNISSSQKGSDLECYVGIAIKSKDLDLCKTLPSKFSYLENIHEDLLKIYGYAERDQWLTQCYVGVATRLNEKEVCNNLEGDHRLWCFIPFSDRSICSQFALERGRDFVRRGLVGVARTYSPFIRPHFTDLTLISV